MLFIWLFLQVMVTCIFWQNTNVDIVKKYLARNKHNWKKKKTIKDLLIMSLPNEGYSRKVSYNKLDIVVFIFLHRSIDPIKVH